MIRLRDQRLFHRKGVVQSCLVVVLVLILRWHFVEGLRVEEYLIRALGHKDILLILEEKRARIIRDGLLLLLCVVIEVDHRVRCRLFLSYCLLPHLDTKSLDLSLVIMLLVFDLVDLPRVD